jgi:hypothetical protein
MESAATTTRESWPARTKHKTKQKSGRAVMTQPGIEPNLSGFSPIYAVWAPPLAIESYSPFLNPNVDLGSKKQKTKQENKNADVL